MKRQLEKLTREQIELREQTEELLRRVGSERDASQQKSQAGKRDGDLRGAADEMRSAASELRRDAPGEAARNGERAVDQLRRLERELSNDSQGTPAAAGSDVKLEAQQIAQEQHRIASEAARLDRNPDAAATADARRRLAGDKERLATRVDELRRTAERAGQAGTGEDAKALADAARTLQRDKIADRMRSTANEMRQGRGGRGSSAEQELARNLDQLAGKLGIDGSPLSTQLEQTRAIRDGLQRAEQQLRDGEARAREATRGDGSRPANPRVLGGKVLALAAPMAKSSGSARSISVSCSGPRTRCGG